MEKKFAFVFPGQGSQELGMLSDMAAHYPVVTEIFSQASDVLGDDLWSICQKGPEERLNQTEYTQPILLTAGVAIWRIWQQLNAPMPYCMAGHSLGEYTALVCANALDFQIAVKLVQVRGQLMQQAIAQEGAMAAIVGLDARKVVQICEEISQPASLVAPANYNSKEQTVIAGNLQAIEQAIILAREQGAKLAKKLSVSVPSHCILMKPAAILFAQHLKSIQFTSPQIPIINNVDVSCYSQPEQIADALVRQLYHPVRWMEIIEYLADKGLQTVIESGPGKVLTGLNKRIASHMTAIAITEPSSLQSALNQIKDLSLIGE